MSNDDAFVLNLFRPTIYKFLRFAKHLKLQGKVLDCGAGGNRPPIALFSKHGYESYGLDNSQAEIKKAKEFIDKYRIEVELAEGDMRDIPFDDEFFECVFSYNASIHLTKKDTEKAVNEMLRVLKKGGILCMNFLWYDKVDPMLGEEKNPGEFWNKEHGEETVHSFFTEEEVEILLKGTKTIYREKIQMKVWFNERYFTESSFDYIVQKE